ncbi:hypothetical protein D3C71_2199800 [compost metagenome]
MLNSGFYVGLGQLDADRFGFRDAELIGVLNFDQQQVIDKFIGTNGAFVGFVTMVQAR